MTRVCQAKVERNDLDETMIICGPQDSQPRDAEAQFPSNHGRSGTQILSKILSSRHGSRQHGEFLVFLPLIIQCPHLAHVAMPNVARSHLRIWVYTTHLCQRNLQKQRIIAWQLQRIVLNLIVTSQGLTICWSHLALLIRGGMSRIWITHMTIHTIADQLGTVFGCREILAVCWT